MSRSPGAPHEPPSLDWSFGLQRRRRDASGARQIDAVARAAHLLDLITDGNFANLLNAAFQQEGEAVRGGVTFQDRSYEAAILSLPSAQVLRVKTLIALK